MKNGLKYIGLLLSLSVVLSACGGLSDTAVTKMSEEVIKTAVAETVQAAVTRDVPALDPPTLIVPTEAKGVPTMIPTDVPPATPTRTPWVITATPVMVTATLPAVVTKPPVVQPSMSAVPCDRAQFIADVTVPDNTVMAPGAGFTKTWRLQNSGSCTWGKGYSLAFHSGNSMGGPATVPLGISVAPGQTIDFSVNLQAPSSDGIYTGVWMLKNASGNFFGIGNAGNVAFWVKVVVGNGVVLTPGTTLNPTQSSSSCQILSASPAYGAVFSPNADFDNKWTVKNNTGKAWSKADVDIKYTGGTKWMKNQSVMVYDLPVDVSPGGEFTFILDAVAPAGQGTYTMTWAIVGGGVNCTLASTIVVK